MAHQVRQRKTDRRLGFECLERRKLLSAVAPAPIGLPDAVAPPAVVSDWTSHHAETIGFAQLGATAPSAAMPIGESPEGAETLLAAMMTLSTDASTPVVSYSLNGATAAPQQVESAPVAPLAATVTLEVTVVTSEPIAITLPPQVPDSGITVGVADAFNTPAATSADGYGIAPSTSTNIRVSRTAGFNKLEVYTSPLTSPIDPPSALPPASYAPDPVGIDPASLVDGSTDSHQSPAAAGVPSRVADALSAPLGKSDPSSSAEIASTGGSHKPDALPEHDAAVGGSADGSLPSSMTINPQIELSNRDSSLDAATANSGEGGFVVIDEATAGLQLDARPNGVTGDAADGSLFADFAIGSRGQTSLESGHSSKLSASDAMGMWHTQVSRDAADGGVIDLADATPPAVDAAARMAEPGDSADAAQDASGLRAPSGAGLFCDMEVALGNSPADAAEIVSQPIGKGAASAAVLDRPAAPIALPPQEELHHRLPQRRAWATPSDNVPLFLGAAAIVLVGGIRAPLSDSDRDRRFHWLQRPQNQARG